MNNTISLKDAIFAQAIADADIALQQLLDKMLSRGAEDGKLSLVIKLSISDGESTNQQTGEVQVEHEPHMVYKVTYSVPDQESMSGALPTAGTRITANRFGYDITEAEVGQVNLFEGDPYGEEQ